MLKQVSKISIGMYYNVVKPKVEDAQSKLILETMKTRNTWTNKELAIELKIDASTIAARINRLGKFGEVRERNEKRKCLITGNTVTQVELVPKETCTLSMF